MIDFFLLCSIGLAVGLAGGYAGIGGAPFLVAVLVLGLGFDQYLAQGTILAVMLGPMSLAGVWVMRDRARILWRYIAIGVVSYAIFSNIGARIAFSIRIDALQALFAILLCGLGLNYLRGRSNPSSERLDPHGPTILTKCVQFNYINIGIISSLIGVVGGLFGIGAGVLLVPMLISWFGLHKDDARTMSLAILLPPVSIGGVLEYSANNSIDWAAALAIFVVYFATNYWGAKWGRAHNTRRFMLVTGTLLFLLGCAILIMALL